LIEHKTIGHKERKTLVVMIETKYCYCDNKAMFYTDVSKGHYVYHCGTPKQILKNKSLKSFIENPVKPCDYREVIVYCTNPIFAKKDDKERTKKRKKRCPYEELVEKVDYFVAEKYFITFQEIEQQCKKLMIPLYNHEKERMYEFCCRVKKHCTDFTKKEYPSSSKLEQPDQ